MQYLRHYQDKMAVYSYDDGLLCRMFPSSLKGLASDWFYSLKPGTLHTFEQVAQAFLTQYSSCQEYKKNSNHLFTVKMAPGESLKIYLTRFQSERAKVHHCSDDVAAAAFISGLQVKHAFFASLVKHDVTEMCEILRRAPGYIHLEEARSSADQGKAPEKKSDSNTSVKNSGNGNNFRKPFQFNNQKTFPANALEAPIFNTPINEIFSTFEDQPWVQRPPPLPRSERNLSSKDFCSYHQGTGHKTVDCKALQRYLQKLLDQGYLKQYALAPGIVKIPESAPSDPGTSNLGKSKDKGKGQDAYKTVKAIF
jgi:hypothetical protein